MERNVDFIRTKVFPQNNDGIRFYERNGFSENDEVRALI